MLMVCVKTTTVDPPIEAAGFYWYKLSRDVFTVQVIVAKTALSAQFSYLPRSRQNTVRQRFGNTQKTSQMVAVCVIPALIGDARLLVEATLDLEDLR